MAQVSLLPVDPTSLRGPSSASLSRASSWAWLSHLAMLASLMVSAYALARFGAHVAVSDPTLQATARTVRAEIVRQQARILWVPEAMMQLANNEADWIGIPSDEKLISLIETRDSAKLWYATFVQSHLRSGAVGEVAYVADPHNKLYQFLPLRDVLSIIVGKQPSHGAVDWSSVEIRVIPRELYALEPMKALPLLISSRDGLDTD